MKIRFGKKSDWKALYKILNKTPELQSMGDKNNYPDYLVKNPSLKTRACPGS